MQDIPEQVCEIRLMPKERSRFSLGEFDTDKSFKGLSMRVGLRPTEHHGFSRG
jgi:hypothetical protein